MSGSEMKRLALIAAFVCSFTFLLSSVCIYKAGLFDRKTESVIEVNTSDVYEGTFVDRNGIDITRLADEPGKPAVCEYPESFSYIIGYNSDRIGLSGLRHTLRGYIFEGGKDNVGASVSLTLDASLQENAYSLLEGTVGSLTVIDAGTGEILAMGSRGDPYIDMNINEIDNAFEEPYIDENGNTFSDRMQLYNSIDEFWYNRATLAEYPPGSCGKIITTTGLVKNGMEDLEYYDEGSELDGTITNFQGGVYGWVGLEDALNHSINTFFANAGLTLGAVRLKQTYKDFMIGEQIELDFTTLDSQFSESGDLSKYNIASIAYGQGSLIMSPFHLAMCASAIMNDGVMMKPYMIGQITNDEKSVYKGKAEVLSKVIDKSGAEIVRELLHSNAFYYGFYDYFDEDEAYIIAKTGTAETGGLSDHIYFTVGVQINEHIFGICIDNVYATQTGFSMKDKVISIIEDLLYTYGA